MSLEERDEGKTTDGHIVRVDWSPNNRSIIAQGSLYNTLRYNWKDKKTLSHTGLSEALLVCLWSH